MGRPLDPFKLGGIPYPLKPPETNFGTTTTGVLHTPMVTSILCQYLIISTHLIVIRYSASTYNFTREKRGENADKGRMHKHGGDSKS